MGQVSVHDESSSSRRNRSGPSYRTKLSDERESCVPAPWTRGKGGHVFDFRRFNDDRISEYPTLPLPPTACAPSASHSASARPHSECRSAGLISRIPAEFLIFGLRPHFFRAPLRLPPDTNAAHFFDAPPRICYQVTPQPPRGASARSTELCRLGLDSDPLDDAVRSGDGLTVFAKALEMKGHGFLHESKSLFARLAYCDTTGQVRGVRSNPVSLGSMMTTYSMRITSSSALLASGYYRECLEGDRGSPSQRP